MRNETDATDLTKALFLGTTPERPEDVAKLLETTQYEFASDRPALHLEAAAFFGQGLVVLTPRTMQQIWLIAYLSWHTVQEQSGFVIVSLVKKRPYDVREYIKGDRFTAYVDRLNQSLAELRNADAGNNPWPSDVPQLDPELSQLRTKEERVIYELACFACSFLLLHETCHAQKRVREEPQGGIAEEIECDRFAIDFLLAGCDKYAEQNNHSPVEVRRKRAMGLFLGLAVILESTEQGLWSPSESHPSSYDRIKQFVEIVDSGIPDPDDPFWVFALCVLLSKLRRDQRLPLVVDFQSCRDLFFKTLAVLKP